MDASALSANSVYRSSFYCALALLNWKSLSRTQSAVKIFILLETLLPIRISLILTKNGITYDYFNTFIVGQTYLDSWKYSNFSITNQKYFFLTSDCSVFYALPQPFRFLFCFSSSFCVREESRKDIKFNKCSVCLITNTALRFLLLCSTFKGFSRNRTRTRRRRELSYTGGIPQRWHSGWDLHYCHTAVHTNVTVVTVSTSATSVVVTVLWQWCTQLCCDSSGPGSTVTAMAATFVCQRCKLTTV